MPITIIKSIVSALRTQLERAGKTDDIVPVVFLNSLFQTRVVIALKVF